MSAADCVLGPLARAARERGEVVEVMYMDRGWWEARAGDRRSQERTAQEACDALERNLGLSRVRRI